MTYLLPLLFRSREADGPDRVGRCTQFVGCHMSHRHGLPGGASRFPGCAARFSGRCVCCKGSRAGLRHRDLTPHPGMRLLDCGCGTGFNSVLFRYARLLVRGADERAKPNTERLREYTDTSLPRRAPRSFVAAYAEFLPSCR